jgi:hypothetical protein
MLKEPCPKCGGRIKVLNTKPLGLSSRVQYCGCNRCGYRPDNNKLINRSTRQLEYINLNPVSFNQQEH